MYKYPKPYPSTAIIKVAVVQDSSPGWLGEESAKTPSHFSVAGLDDMHKCSHCCVKSDGVNPRLLASAEASVACS